MFSRFVREAPGLKDKNTVDSVVRDKKNHSDWAFWRGKTNVEDLADIFTTPTVFPG